MLICLVHTENMQDLKLEAMKELIVDYFTTGPGAGCKVDSLYLQKAKKRV